MSNRARLAMYKSAPYLSAASILMVLTMILMSLTSCSPSWKKNTTAGYEITGTTISETYTSAKMLCDSGTIKQEDCTKIKEIYNKVRDSYLVAGNALTIAINTDDQGLKNQNLIAYTNALNDVAKFLPELIRLAQTLGANTSKEIK